MLRIRNAIIFALATLVLWPLESEASTAPVETLTRILDKGLFKRHDIELVLYVLDNGGTEAMAAVAAGQIDAESFGTPILLGIARRIPIDVLC